MLAHVCVQGLFSDGSAEKTAPPTRKKPKHVTMKCGWICLDCRQVEFKRNDLGSHLCKGLKVHKRVLCAGYMCQNCPAISDDITAFIREDCPCDFSEGPGPASHASPASAARPAGASPDSPGPKPLTIRTSPGKIGGTYLEVHYKTHTIPAATSEPEAAKPPKQTWRDDSLPQKACAEAIPKPAITKPGEDEHDKSPMDVKPRPKPSCDPLKAKSPAKLLEDHAPHRKDEVMAAVHNAQRELQQLLLLQALQKERKSLEELLLKKQQNKSSATVCASPEHACNSCLRSINPKP